MMYGYGSDSGFWFVGMHFHFLFVLLLLFGFVAGLVWMFRFANKEQVKQWFWVSVIAGALGMILTAPFAYRGMEDMMQNWSDYRDGTGSSDTSVDDDNYRGMMDWYYEQSKDAADTSIAQ